MREELEQRFGPEYARYLRLLQGVRDRVLARRRGHPENPRLFQRLVAGPLQEALSREDRPRALAILEEALGEVLSSEELAAALDQAWEEEGY